jgi:hypothetical protein
VQHTHLDHIVLKWIAVALSLGVFLGGCRAPLGGSGAPETPTVRACTEIGCSDGLIFDLIGDVPAEFDFLLMTPAGADIAAQCPAGGELVRCQGDQVVVDGFAPEELTVRITWEAGDFVKTFTPAYEKVQPNGPGCPPVCQQATVAIDLSASGEPDVGVEPPPATLRTDGREQVAGIGTYCWPTEGEAAALCVDKIGVPTPQEPLEVQSPLVLGLTLPLEGDPDVLSLSVAQVSEGDELDASADGWRWWAYTPGEEYATSLEQQQDVELTLEPGLYVLRVFVQWQDVGDVAYGFLLNVQ